MQKLDVNITENEAIFIDTPPEINLGTKTVTVSKTTDSFSERVLLAYFQSLVNYGWHSFFKHPLRSYLNELVTEETFIKIDNLLLLLYCYCVNTHWCR